MAAAAQQGAEPVHHARPARRHGIPRVGFLDFPSERRVSLFGVPLDCLTMQETLHRVESIVEEGCPRQHIVLNAAKVVALRDDAELRSIVASCALVNADGQAIVWAGRLLGHDVPERVTGIDLMDEVLGLAAARGWSVYFLGATPDVVDRVVAIECERFPGLRVAGWRDGYWSSEEEVGVVEDVRRSGAEVLFVAMPSPRKELFLARYCEQLGTPFQMGVGGSFDVVAGVVSRAPRWMQRCGLEWFWRLLCEPRRMFVRYLAGNTRFVALTLRERLGRRSAAPEPPAAPEARGGTDDGGRLPVHTLEADAA